MKAVNQRQTENYAPNYKGLLKDIKENSKNKQYTIFMDGKHQDRNGFSSSQLNSNCSINKNSRDFPGGPVAKTLSSQCRGPGSIPGQGARSHMLQLRPRAAKLKKKKKKFQLRFSQARAKNQG